MKYTYLFLIPLFIIITNSSTAQNLNRIYFEADAVTKISVGETSRARIDYPPNFSVNVPRVSNHENPIYGLNVSLNYRLNSNFSAGMGTGVNFVFERRPDARNAFHDKVMIPFFGRLRYHKDINPKWLILSDLNAGYQYIDFRHGYTDTGYLYREKGGLLLNLDFGLGLKIHKFTPIFKIGYELNQSSHINKVDWITTTSVDQIDYKTYYHLLKFSLSLSL